MSNESAAKPVLYIHGMHGMGDNLHQRALIKKLRPDFDIWLETSWPQIYHDMPDLHLLAKGTSLRTQLKNAAIQASRFESTPPHRIHKTIKVHYHPDQMRAQGSVVAAMLAGQGFSASDADLSFPVPSLWETGIAHIVAAAGDRPILIYRPLVDRPEWGGCSNRNPDFDAYKTVYEAIRDDYFVVSVADLVPGKEWTVGHEVKADLTFHDGELAFEQLAALAKAASLVYASPGFAIPLARCLGTPCICVFGGYENSGSFFYGNGPYLGIDPIVPCQCFSHSHKCRKEIDLPAATQKAKEFSHAAIGQSRA